MLSTMSMHTNKSCFENETGVISECTKLFLFIRSFERTSFHSSLQCFISKKLSNIVNKSPVKRYRFFKMLSSLTQSLIIAFSMLPFSISCNKYSLGISVLI